MKPKYLINDALFAVLKLFFAGGIIIGVSIHMAITSRDVANKTLVGLVSVVVAVLGAVIYSYLRYCRFDEKGITFYHRFKKECFVSWESITRVEFQEYGTGRGMDKLFVIYNDEYFSEPASASDVNEEKYARGLRLKLKENEVFSNYLSHYREDLKIEY